MNKTPTNKNIIGSWRIEGGDYPLIDEYHSDGTLVQHVGDSRGEPIRFRIEADILVVSIEQPDGRIVEQRTRFEISENTLTFFDSPDSKRVFRRINR